MNSTSRKVTSSRSSPVPRTRGEAQPSVRRYAERANNIVHWSDFETGGHFAALETPELLVQDIRAFFASLPA